MLPIFLLFLFMQSEDEFQPASIQVTTPRALKEAVIEMNKKYGTQITYEDPPFLAPENWENAKWGGQYQATIIPAFRCLHFDFSVSKKSDFVIEPLPTLQRLLAAHREQDGIGDFKIIDGGTFLHIVPKALISKDGTRVRPFLDHEISFEYAERTRFETLTLLAERLGAIVQRRIVINALPYPALSRETIFIGSKEDPARDILTRTLDGIAYVWTLCNSPVQDEGDIIINLLPIPKAREAGM